MAMKLFEQKHMGVAQLYAQKNTKFEFSLLSWVSHAINISKQIHQTFPNSLCKRPNHTSVKVTQNPQGSQNPLHDITFLVLQLLLQNFNFAGRFEFFDLDVFKTRDSPGVTSNNPCQNLDISFFKV